MADPMQSFENDGFVWFRNLLDESACRVLEEAGETDGLPGKRAAPDGLFAQNILTNAALNEAVESLGYQPAPVRILSFDKSEAVNWALPWHQDRVIAVAERSDVKSYSNWPRKESIWHCEPPIELLENMIFARIHLDPADAENGCLEIAPGSHELGLVPADKAQRSAEKGGARRCIAGRGDVLFVKALILHRSSASQTRRPRRAIRVDYAATELPHPLKWAFRQARVFEDSIISA